MYGLHPSLVQMTMSHQTIVERFRRARGDQSLVVLEGIHTIKHAIRFGAELIEVVTSNVDELCRLGAEVAPDIAGRLDSTVCGVPETVFEQLAPVAPPTGVIAIAKRPETTLAELLDDPAPAPVVFLENPRNLLNIGAAVRVAAAAGAVGLVTTGPQDPWHPAALIASAGLHFAVSVARTAEIPVCDRRVVVVDPKGEPLRPGSIPAHAILAFGSEREGLSPELIAAAEQSVSIPMDEGVSSLNLATAVAVVLYTWRFGR